MDTLRIPSFTLAFLVAGSAIIFGQPSPAEACDSCNRTFEMELKGPRADTPTGRHYAQTLENHSRFTVLGFNEPAAEDADAPPVLAQAEGSERAQQLNPTPGAFPRGAIAQAQRGQQRQAGANPNPNNRDFAEIFEGHDFIEIINRDENLPNTPPTGYVPQDTEPDIEFTIELHEGRTYLGQGVIYDGFLTNGSIPGPTLRAKQGDIIKFNVRNAGTVPHGASIHAAYTQTSKYVGQIPPGETRSVTFRATYPGVFMYHCAPGGHAIPMHVMAGQYGMIVIEPEQTYKLEEELGHPPDVSLYVVQHEVYASGKDAVESNPAYAAFNGQPFRYVEDPIAVRPGDYIRIYYMNVGPNLLSTFHFVGLIWDYVYWQGHPEARLPGGQTVTAGPSDSFVIELRIPPDEGAYTMLTHVVGYATRGTIGLLVAEAGIERPDVVLADGPSFTEAELTPLLEGAVRTIAPFKPGSRELEYPVRYGADIDEVVVMIKGNSYNPSVIEIEPGTTVTWINDEVFGYMAGEFSGIHNAVSTSAPEAFATPLLGHGEKASVTFTESGEYTYICTPHPYMQGRIIVRTPPEPEEGPRGCTATGGTSGTPGALAFSILFVLAMISRKRASHLISQRRCAN
ncbi:MAG: plastocyanin/azurin family copper-binding protein [Bradymonadaceae bacterium]